MALQPTDTLFQGSVPVDTTITRADLEPGAVADTAETVAEATDAAVREVQSMADDFFAALPRLAVAVMVVLLFWLVASGVRSLIARVTPGPRDAPVGVVLGRMAYAGLILLGVLVGCVVVFPGFEVTTLVGTLGIGGVVLGFAFQDIFQNLLAGILILLRQPFREGDEITSGEYTGTVEAIETRATFIRTYNGVRVIVPNSQIYTDPVQVITAYDRVRSQYDVGIGYGDDIETAKGIALETIKGIEGVLEDPAPDVVTWDLAGSSVNLRVRWWSNPTRKSVVELRDKVLVRVSQALLSQGVDLPFPTQQILFHDQTEATDGDRTRQREGWPVPADGDAPAPARISMAVRAAGPDPDDAEPSADALDAPPLGDRSAPSGTG